MIVSENNFNISLNVFPNPASNYVISKNHLFDQIQIIYLDTMIQVNIKKLTLITLKKHLHNGSKLKQ